MSDYNLSKLQNRVNTELRKIDLWMKKNKLLLNHSKTHQFLLDKQLNRLCPTNFNVSLNSMNIKCMKSTKYLGIYIDENLKWSCHIQHLSLQLACYSGLLQRIRNRKTLCMLYYSFIYSRIQYGIVTWVTANKTLMQLEGTLIATADFVAAQGATGVERLWKGATGHQRLGTTALIQHSQVCYYHFYALNRSIRKTNGIFNIHLLQSR